MTVLIDWNATTWRYTFTDPGPDWTAPGFDDSAWSVGQAGFGNSGNAAMVAAGNNTSWTTDDIWLRHELDVPPGEVTPVEIFGRVDDVVDIYINGDLVGDFELNGLGTVNTTPTSIAADARNSGGWILGAVAIGTGGRVVLAAHARNTIPLTPRFVDLRVVS